MSGTLSSACAVWLRLLVGVSDCGPSQKMPEKPGWKFDASIWTRKVPAPTLGKLNWPKASVVVVAAVLPSLRSKARRTLGSPSSSGKTAEMLVGFEMEKSRHTRPVTAPAMGAGTRAGRAPSAVSVSALMPVRPIRTVPAGADSRLALECPVRTGHDSARGERGGCRACRERVRARRVEPVIHRLDDGVEDPDVGIQLEDLREDQ